MSAPDASCARTMTGFDGYFPVPMMSREVNVLPAMTNGSGFMGLTTADEVHDLDGVAVVEERRIVGGSLEDHEVVLDRHAPRVDVERRQQLGDGQWAGQVERIAVQGNRQ